MSALGVWIGEARVGRLIQKDNGNLQFRYDAGYDGPPISHSLPVQEEAHPHRVVRAVFGGLLPEGDVRRVLARNLGTSEANDYRLLDEVGGDVAGAISLLSEDDRPPTAPELRPLDDHELARVLEELPERPLAVDPSGGVRLSLAGAQPKLPAILAGDEVALPLNSAAPTTHILKPEPAGFPGLVDNEAFCMSLARRCELQVAEVRKSETLDGLPYLIVARYDRDLTSDPIRRLHQEDFCQALGVPSDRKYQQDGGPTFAQAVELVRECTAVPARELPQLLKALAFHWIVGNCDAHGKNYSLLYDRGAPALAPRYDVVSTVRYERLTTRMAMSIGRTHEIQAVDRRSWAELSSAAELRPAFVAETVDELLSKAAAEAAELVRSEEHGNDAARAIAARVQTLASS